MAYDATYLTLVNDVGGKVGRKWWDYQSVDALATIYAIGYVSNAAKIGMAKGDIVTVTRWTTAVPTTNAEKRTAAGVANIVVGVTMHVVMGVSTAGAADLSDGQAIAVTNT